MFVKDVAILGGGMTRFGKLDDGLLQLLVKASMKAFEDSKTSDSEFDHVYVGNMASGEFNGKSGIANELVSDLALEPSFASRIENTSGSGGAALYTGWLSVASGLSNLTLVVGGEKMTHKTTDETTEIVSSLIHDVENAQGATLLSFAGLLARYYMDRYDASRESLAKVAVKNHHNASLNPNAHFQKEITLETVLQSPMIADPLRLYDFCPISDGAAAVVLAPADDANKYVEDPVRIIGIGGATDTHVIHERRDITSLRAVEIASRKAYQMAKKSPSEIDVAELHDMSTILEIVISEALGFFEKGCGWKSAECGETSIEGKLPINTSGGLKAKGHPIGASGVSQLIELINQINGNCGRRQVSAEVGLACNLGGFENNAVVTLVEGILN